MRLAVLFLLLSSTALGQAVAPVQAPAPAPSFPRPGFTPAGAGASHGSLAAPRQDVPRSPNTRMLPASAEPGLWAADEVKASSVEDDSSARLGGVLMPVPKGHDTPEMRGLAAKCVATMNDALRATYQTKRMESLSPYAQWCLAARLYKYCAANVNRLFTSLNQRGVAADPGVLERYEALEAVANRLVEISCSQTTMPKKADEIYQLATARWLKVFEGRQ